MLRKQHARACCGAEEQAGSKLRGALKAQGLFALARGKSEEKSVVSARMSGKWARAQESAGTLHNTRFILYTPTGLCHTSARTVRIAISRAAVAGPLMSSVCEMDDVRCRWITLLIDSERPPSSRALCVVR